MDILDDLVAKLARGNGVVFVGGRAVTRVRVVRIVILRSQ